MKNKGDSYWYINQIWKFAIADPVTNGLWGQFFTPIGKQKMSAQCWSNAGPTPLALGRHWISIERDPAFTASWPARVTFPDVYLAEETLNTGDIDRAECYSYSIVVTCQALSPEDAGPTVKRHWVNTSCLLWCRFTTQYVNLLYQSRMRQKRCISNCIILQKRACLESRRSRVRFPLWHSS